MDDDSISDHKLCGFLCVVLSLNPSPDAHVRSTLSFNTRLHIFGEGSEVGFKSEDGVVLSLINSNSNAKALVSTGASSPESGKGKSAEKESVSSRKRWKRIGVVHGSVSVVHQLQALVVNKCVHIIARVVRVAVGHCGGVRVVVLVDLYLPIMLWSGWQFPKLGSVAAALFRHLSCDWGERSLMLVDNAEGRHEGGENIWNLFECHVLGCKLRCRAPDTSRRKLFELHEIFSSVHGGAKGESPSSSKVYPADASCRSGIWQLPDDVLTSILNSLCPVDLVRVSSTCRHLRSLAALIMPCMKLKLFPHQQVAIEWMLRRERDSEVLPHPLYMNIVTEDGFAFYVNMVSGEIVTGTIPTIRDFHGGLFCDEPGLGKTITALSLILKTQGTLPEAPDGVQVVWCMRNADQRCGYYELDGENATNGNMGQNARRRQLSVDKFSPGVILNSSQSLQKRTKYMDCPKQTGQITNPCTVKGLKSPIDASSTPATDVIRHARSLTHIKRNLLHAYELASGFSKEGKFRKNRSKNSHVSNGRRRGFCDKQASKSYGSQHGIKRSGNAAAEYAEYKETWVQCDACHKWRKLADTGTENITTAWFCSMNSDPLHQSCVVPEESWDYHHPITYLPGFHSKGTSGGKIENISFFTSVLKEHYELINSETEKVLTWLAKLSPDKLSEMETTGLVLHAGVPLGLADADDHEFHKIFQAFGLIKRVYRGATRWYYPKALKDLIFDQAALRAALCQPLDSFRLYLSRATLVIVPLNLVDHWKTQIQKHVRPGQLRVFVWTDHKKPSAHSLAWDYDIVITTFNRLSAEWSPHNRSVLMQVHWLRVMLDEGHTLGSSLSLTNKLQMAISLRASNRWLLTGTPTPNTPNSQLSHLQPMLKFLHEEAYGESQKSWEAGILRPFEAEMEEGRARLLQLLHRCMISARKVDLHTIPPCIKKVTFLNFTEEHARSYNELVLMVRRNILMADWNDPSHVESLLNPKQWKFCSTTTRNVRLSCCVAGHIKVEEAGQDIQETMDILVEGGLDPISEEYAFIKHNLRYGGNCMSCKEWCRLPVITPCRHLLCLDCASLDSERCVIAGCGYLYEMQSPEDLTRPENPNPKWPVPKDLIELQPSYDQSEWHPEWHSTSSSKVTYLVQRLKDLQEFNRKIIHSIHEGNDAKQIDELLFCSQKNDSITSLHHDINSRSSNESFKIPLEKVLIFSQFLEHINVIEQQLTGAGIKFAGLYSPLHSCRKMESLASFQHDASCIALLMDGSAALGLDLSFVTHVFLMEPIWDRSMEEQVISRAHRMGATRPIYVETLAMRGTVEEQMMKFLQNADECRRFLKEEFGQPDREGARAHRSLHDFAESNYLAKLSFIHTNSMT